MTPPEKEFGDRLLGVGMGYRSELAAHLEGEPRPVDFVEVITERYMRGDRARAMAELATLKNKFGCVIPHGVTMSIAGVPWSLPDNYLSELRDIANALDAPFVSDHLCYTRSAGIDLGHLTPSALTYDLLDEVSRRVELVQNKVGRQLVLENITRLISYDECNEISEPDFFGKLTEATGCGLLLDLTNIYTNATNFGFSALDEMLKYPLASVRQIHLAGGVWHRGLLIDSHSQPVSDDVWQLLDEFVSAAGPVAVLIEHDQHFDGPDQLVGQLDRARAMMSPPDRESAAITS